MLIPSGHTAPAAQCVNLEAQEWWAENGDTMPPHNEGRHVHLGTCFPLHQKISGTITLDAVVKLHNNPGVVKSVRVQVFDKLTVSKSVNLSCATMDCTFTVPLVIDTTKVPNGWREFRMTANIPASTATFGRRMYQTTRWHAQIDNPGASTSNGSEKITRSPGAAGWYEQIGYQNIFCGYNESGFRLVTEPQSGQVTMTCKFDRDTAFASIDPDVHHGNFGTVLLDTTGGTKTFVIDTTTLTDGPHKLMVATSRTISTGKSTGVLVLPFNVDNGVENPPPATTEEPPATTEEEPPPAPSEELRIATDGTDTGDCKAAACKSLTYAYQKAESGDTILVSGGTYGGQTLARAAATGVTIKPAAGATVSFSGINVKGSQGFTLQDVKVNGWIFVTPLNGSSGGTRPSDQTYVNVDSTIFFVRDGLNITYRGGSIGGTESGDSPTVGAYEGSPQSENILFDGVRFHDIGRQEDPSAHVECLFIQESTGVTVRNSTFEGCDVFDVYVNPIIGGSVTDVTFDHNTFDAATPSGFYAVYLNHVNGVSVTSNTFHQGLHVEPTATNVTGCGNTGISILTAPCNGEEPPPPTCDSECKAVAAWKAWYEDAPVTGTSAQWEAWYIQRP